VSQATQPLPASTTLSLKTLLVATDFSPASENALRFAVNLSRVYGAKLVLAHVLPPPQEAVTEHRICDHDVKLRAETEARLAKLGDFEGSSGVEHEEVILEGSPQETVADFIGKREPDLVVVGTHGRTGFRELLMGSVAEAIFRHTDCPVITVGPRVRFPHVDSAKIEKVLLASDLQGNQHALPYALSIARENNARLLMVHVLEGTGVLPFDVPDRFAAAAKKQMWQTLADQGYTGTPELIVEMGRPAREILATASIQDVDLIVMGVHTGSASSHAPWAVAHQVVGRASCPVLTVRE
jgi:nucleotide-binding universal stress UspA family protein